MNKYVLIGVLVALIAAVIAVAVLQYFDYWKQPEVKVVEPIEEPEVIIEEVPGLNVTLFTRNDCKPCVREREFIESLLEDYPRVELNEYNIDESPAAGRLFNATVKELGLSRGVPIIVVNTDYYVGFDSAERIGKNVKTIIDQAYRRLPPPQQ